MLKMYKENNPNEKIKISKTNLKKIIISISHNGGAYKMIIIESLFDLLDCIIDHDIIELIKIDTLKFDQQIINFFESKSIVNANKLEDTESVLESKFIKYMMEYDIDNINKMIDNKFMPKAEYLYNLVIDTHYSKKLFEIISIFCNLSSIGLVIDDELYYYLHIMGIKNLHTLNFPNVSAELKKYINDKTNKSKSNKNGCVNNIKSIEHLRELFRSAELPIILIYECSDNKIQPDEVCFYNTLKNYDINVVKHVISKYKYKPSILDILSLNSMQRRIFLFKYCYPDQKLIK
jgi:hypothetical protein